MTQPNLSRTVFATLVGGTQVPDPYAQVTRYANGVAVGTIYQPARRKQAKPTSRHITTTSPVIGKSVTTGVVAQKSKLDTYDEALRELRAESNAAKVQGRAGRSPAGSQLDEHAAPEFAPACLVGSSFNRHDGLA